MHAIDDNSAGTPGIYLLRAPSLTMIASPPRKSDAFLILVGLVIFLLLILAVVLLVRRQPQLAPKSGAMADRTSTALTGAVTGCSNPVRWQG